MKVKELVEALKGKDENMDVRVDVDENGYYDLEEVEVTENMTNSEKSYVNLISSNEQ